MSRDKIRRSELREQLCEPLGATVTEMLLDYMPSADWMDSIDRQFMYFERRFTEMDRRFELINERFEQVDRRFEEIDRKFELIDERFEQIDRRFEQIENRLDRIEERVTRLESSVTALVESQRTWIRWMISATITSALGMIGAIVAIAVSAM